jgi:hypothetical protein
VNAEAQELFDIIMNNRQVWERERTLGGTLLDLDFDGTPEFLVLYGNAEEWMPGQSFAVYRIAGGSLIEIAEIAANSYTGAETPNRHIFLYTDDDGNRSWAVSYEIPHGVSREYRISLFDFTGNQVSEFVKFSELWVGGDWDNRQFVMNGQEAYLTDEEIRAYAEAYARYEAELAWFEKDPDDYMANSAQEFFHQYEPFSMGGSAEGVYPPMVGDWFWNSQGSLYETVSQKFSHLKFIFERSLIPTAYRLDPNMYWGWHHGEDKGGTYWFEHSDAQLQDSVVRLANAYVTDDTGYLLDPHAFSLGAMAKPVVYLYPEEPLDVRVTVDFPHGGYFTAVYPDYGSGWNVTAYPDGTLINHADGREYQYLYWAGRGTAVWDMSQGFVVKGSDTVAFFQEKLAYLGLIPREYNEFIVYYLPLMQKNAYNLITFQTEVYERNVVMNISPEPDSILRIFMAFMPLDAPPVNPIPEQRLEKFERTGFAVIEWGGTEVAGR